MKTLKRLFAGLIGLTFILVILVFPVHAATLDQSFTTNDSSAGWANNTGTNYLYLAQQVLIGQAGTLDSVDVYLKRAGSSPTGNVTCEIWSDSGNSPNVKISDTQTFALSSLTTSLAWYTITFATKPAIAVSDKIWIVLYKSSASDTDYPLWGVDSAAGYNGMNAKWKTAAGSWEDRGFGDANFKQYYSATVSGPANMKTFNGLASASVKTINGLAIASVKSRNGLE